MQGVKYLIVFLCICCSAFVQAETLKLDKLVKVKWSKAESKNFTVITDAKPHEAEIYVRELENFRHFITVYLQQPIVEGLKPPVFLLIKNDKLFKRLGLPKMWGGVFTPTLSGPYSIAKSSGFRSGNMKPSFEAHIVRHELVHYLVENALSKFKPPLWYSEGLAEYLATYSDNKNKITVGSLSFIEFRFLHLRKHVYLDYADIGVESLFKARKRYESEKESEIEKEIQRFYGRSIATVHYLLSDNKLTAELAHYLKLIDAGISVDEAFASAFNRSYEQLDEEIVDYLKGRRVYGRGFAKDQMSFPDVTIQSKALSKEEALLELLEVITKVTYDFNKDGQDKKIVNMLDKYAKNNIRSELLKLDVFERLGLDEKLSRVDMLLKQHPNNKNLLTIKGEVLASMARIKFVAGNFDPSLNLQARKALRSALKQDPLLGRAYYALADTYLIEPYKNENYKEAAVGYDSAIFFRNNPKYYLRKADMLLADGSPEMAYQPLRRYFQLSDSRWEEGYGGFLLVVTELATTKKRPITKVENNRILFQDGSVYSGSVKNGWPEGKGIFKSVSGFTYDGLWKNGMAHGKGKLTGPHSLVFEGEFFGGNVTGYGKLAIGSPEDRLTYEGHFINGYENGLGRLEKANQYVYDGEWFKGRYHGKGQITLANGKELKATWGLNRVQIKLDDGASFYGYLNEATGEISKNGICMSPKEDVSYCRRAE